MLKKFRNWLTASADEEEAENQRKRWTRLTERVELQQTDFPLNEEEVAVLSIGTAEDMMQFLWVKRRIFYELLKIEACILMEIYLNTHNISNSDY